MHISASIPSNVHIILGFTYGNTGGLCAVELSNRGVITAGWINKSKEVIAGGVLAANNDSTCVRLPGDVLPDSYDGESEARELSYFI